MQAERTRTAPAGPAAGADPFTAAAEISRAVSHMRTRLLHQRDTLLRATAAAADTDADAGSITSSPLLTPRLAASPRSTRPAPLPPEFSPLAPARRATATPALLPSVASESNSHVQVTRARSAQHTAHAAHVRAMVLRSARKHTIQTSGSSPEMVRFIPPVTPHPLPNPM